MISIKYLIVIIALLTLILTMTKAQNYSITFYSVQQLLVNLTLNTLFDWEGGNKNKMI